MDQQIEEGPSEPNTDSLENMLRRSLVSRNKQTILVRSPDGSIEFRCVECPMRYTDKERMELHLCMHNKEYRFICTVCGTGLKRREHLERHMMGHQEIRPYPCEECGKAFKRREHLNIHSAIHSGERNLSCPMCDRCFHRKDHLQKHLQSHTNKFKRQGSLGENEVKTELDEAAHLDVTGVTNAMRSDVIVQMEETMQYDELLAKNVGQSDDPERPYACLLCAKTYKRKDHLKLHTQSHVKKDRFCSECGKGFPNDEHLLFHMKTHVKSESLLESDEITSSIEPEPPVWQDVPDIDMSLLVPRSVSLQTYHRPHECPICHKRFKRKQHLKVHSNVHTKPNNSIQLCDFTIWCSICNAGFRTNEDFEGHDCMMLDGNSENINEEQIQMSAAKNDEQFLVKSEPPNTTEYNQPIVQIADDATPPLPVPQRVFVCKYCGKPFRRRDHYKIHLNIHTGNKSFFCPDCGKGFYRKDHLQKHTAIHKKRPATRGPPDLLPLNIMPRKTSVQPEITIHAPSNTKLRVPLQIKVPYEVVMSTEAGEHRTVVDPSQNDHNDS